MKIVKVEKKEVKRLYERFAPLRANTMYRGNDGYQFFARALYDSVLVVELPFCMLRLVDYDPPRKVTVHIQIDSKEVFRGIEELREVAEYVFRNFNVRYAESVIPAGKSAFERLLKRIGFRYVKTLRKGLYNGTIYIDGEVYRLRRADICHKENTKT